MNAIKVFLMAVLAIGMNISCSAQTNKDNKEANISKANELEVYYFHYTRRCATVVWM